MRSRHISKYHPFTAYFEQLPEWDGKDRVSALARRVSDDPVWVNGFHRWMLGLSAQWMQFRPDTNSTNSVAPPAGEQPPRIREKYVLPPAV